MAKALLLAGLLCLVFVAFAQDASEQKLRKSTTTTTTTWDADHPEKHEEEDDHADEEEEQEEGDDAEGEDEEDELAEEEELINFSKAQLTALHGLLDLDADGKLTFDEATGHVTHFHRVRSEKDAAAEMAELDTDKDSQLSLEEVLAAEAEDDKADAETRFGAADRPPKDRYLNLEELASYLHPWTDEASVQAVTQIRMGHHDMNEDKVLSEEEFQSIENLGEDETHKTFILVDSDESGGISVEELQQFESGKLEFREAVKGLFSVTDLDGDSFLSLEEFLSVPHHLGVHNLHAHFSEMVDHYEL